MTREHDLIKLASELLGLKAKVVSLDADLVDDLGADDLDVVELIGQVEEHYQVLLPENAAETVKTLHDILEQLEQQLGAEA